MHKNLYFEKSLLTIIFIIILSFAAYSQHSILPNEKSLFAFQTSAEKKVILSCDTTDKYLIFRLINKNKTELEFPEKTKDSWKKFEYSYYLRGGDIDNEGMDLNYIYFIKDSLQYIIYDTYSAVDSSSNVGLKIIDLKANSTKELKCKKGTVKGTLTEFRNNDLIKKGDKLFD